MTRRMMATIFVVAFLAYLAVGLYLAMGVHFFIGDSLSRVQSAQSVLFSRDPHVSAIGFIFTPLTALVQLPLTALTPWWHPMTTEAVSASIMSAAFMAGSVMQVAGIARDRALPAGLTTGVIACYALNPMIVFYAANGMSEAPYLFFLAWASRRLIRWVDSDDVHDLVTAGVALGFAYLTRYDGAAAAAAAGLMVGVVTWRRRDRANRTSRVILDVAIVGAPSVLAFLGWAITSWLITGNAFAQFTSEYGNSAIIAASGGSGSSTIGEALLFSMTELAILAPLLPLLFVAVLIVRHHRKRIYPLAAPVAVIGAVLAFQILTYARGSTFGFLRFYMTVILLAAAVALLAVPARAIVPTRRLGPRAALPEIDRRPRRSTAILAVSAVVVMAVSIGSTAVGMSSPHYAPQEFALRSIVDPQPDSVDQRHLDAQRVVRSFSTERALAQWLDAQQLPEGSVICDTVYGFAVVAQSARPKQFVIPSDQDFTEILNNPADHGVQYMLAVPRSGRGESDALNIRFPTIYENGAQISVLVLEAPNDGSDLPDWRIYRVVRSAS